MTGPRRRASWAVPAALLGLLAAWWRLPERGRFDEADWKANAGNYDGDNPRAGMLRGLERRIAAGAARADVEKLLGPPDQAAETRAVYYLGRDAVGPSFCVYQIDYDAAGLVTNLAWRRQ